MKPLILALVSVAFLPIASQACPIGVQCVGAQVQVFQPQVAVQSFSVAPVAVQAVVPQVSVQTVVVPQAVQVQTFAVPTVAVQAFHGVQVQALRGHCGARGAGVLGLRGGSRTVVRVRQR